jgi:hypothetical protein
MPTGIRTVACAEPEFQWLRFRCPWWIGHRAEDCGKLHNLLMMIGMGITIPAPFGIVVGGSVRSRHSPLTIPQRAHLQKK